MYKGASKFIALSTILFAACGGGSEANEADSLVTRADSAVAAGNYTLATELLDTLKSRYPTEIKALREGMNIRARANEGLIKDELQTTDSLEAVCSHRIDSLSQYFTLVNNPELVEGYYVIKEYATSSLFDRSGLEARITPEGQFYMISSLAGSPVKHTSVTVTVGGESASSSSVAYDGDRNYRSGNTEMITFISSECDSIGKLLSKYQGKPVRITFTGARSTSMQLPQNDAKSIALAYNYSEAITTSRKLAAKKELLDKQLMLARDQAARTSTIEK
ncbi:MAG: hypothetical protein HDS29_05705 [Bacteroides sp.]|nr:hypothetical protein [Bacteroides sp.]